MGWWKSLLRKAGHFRHLSPADGCLLGSAWVGLAVTRLRLRFSSFEHLPASLPVVARDRADPQGDLAEARHLQRLVALAARLLTGTTCLVRALTLVRMLARRGIPAALCIGVGESIHSPQAHAWVEVAGQPVGEADDLTARFRRLEAAGGSPPKGGA